MAAVGFGIRGGIHADDTMLMPLLSARDAAAGTEGTIDPLGLYSIADTLGVKLIPGIRERMYHPRFLTVMAVSAAVTSEFDDEVIASDGISEPWQVYEWHVVEGLVRCVEDTTRLAGLPGREKVGAAIRDGVPVSARRYLKTPAAFGLHGIYRLLARTLGIDDGGRLGEAGYRLLGIWRDEQGLPGFYESGAGPGANLLRLWRGAVADGLSKGAVSRSRGWEGWQPIADHLAPRDAGPKERREIARLIVAGTAGYTRDVVDHLRSPEGKAARREIEARRRDDGVWSERAFHRALRPKTTGTLRELLDAIDRYELFARLLLDAFDDCLHLLSQRRGRTPTSDLATCKLVKKAARDLPGAFGEAADALAPFEQSGRFITAFQLVSERLPPADWVQTLMEHHRKIQLAKPPNGKTAWAERFDDGSFVVRPGYVRDHGGIGDDSYVHTYRLASLWSFATDLGLV